MPKLAYGLICKSCAIDRTTNQLSIFEVVDEVVLVANGAPPPDANAVFVPMEHAIVTQWSRLAPDEPEVPKLLISVRFPDGSASEKPLSSTISLESHQRTRNVLRLGGFRWKGFGTYNYVISTEADGVVEQVAELPLVVLEGSERPDDVQSGGEADKELA